MNTPVYSFSGEMARLQRANAESHDNVVRQSKVLAALNLRTGERVLEVGCGGGYYTSEAARFVGPTGRVCAIDISPDQIRAAQQRCAEFGWVECRAADIALTPYGDGEFAAVLAVQVLEYVADLDAGLSQIHRMLRPGGRLVAVSTDWSSAVWHSENASRMRRVLTAWEPHKPWLNLPSILGARLRRVGLQPLRQTPIPILNTSYNPASASYWVARAIRSSVVGRQNVTEEEAEGWFYEFSTLEESGAYFFSLTPVLTEAVKCSLKAVHTTRGGKTAATPIAASPAHTPFAARPHCQIRGSTPAQVPGTKISVCHGVGGMFRRLGNDYNVKRINIRREERHEHVGFHW